MQWRVNIPPLTRLLLALLVVFSLSYQGLRYGLDYTAGHYLALVPQWALFTPWVYFTATYSEQNIVTILIAGATIFYGGKYLERAWGSREFGKFILLTTLIPNFATSLVYVLLFALSQNDDLAFYKRQPDLSSASTGGSQLQGDASETFAFSYFWPDMVQPPIAAVADGVYNALVALRICTPFSAEDVETSNEHASVRSEGGLPNILNQGGRRGENSRREEAERRRAIALKALDQRLHAATATGQPPAPPLATEPINMDSQIGTEPLPRERES
ncbi:MAG: hypothetical protein Q9190_002618 [Brigantiaea leucoxantha]